MLESPFSKPKLLFISIASSLFILYPDITWLPFQFENLLGVKLIFPILSFSLKFIFFIILHFTLLRLNLFTVGETLFQKRLMQSSLIALVFFGIYGSIAFSLFEKVRHFGSLVLFQFFMVSLLCSMLGYIYNLYNEKRKKELVIEELTIKNLQSQYDALTNQINPHFFFNSLNGLTSLIRKDNEKETIDYVNNLSDVFRYILQSNQKGLITLDEELKFVDSFKYMMEIRFAKKLKYNIAINKAFLEYKLPVLSILPLLENVVVHNTIDSDHKMLVEISINDANELVISNPIHAKLSEPVTNGTGLKNLQDRFSLLMNKSIRIINDGVNFTVFLPLK